MAIYIGASEKLKMFFGGMKMNAVIGSQVASMDSRLMSSDGYFLTDSTGAFLMPKEDN